MKRPINTLKKQTDSFQNDIVNLKFIDNDVN